MTEKEAPLRGIGLQHALLIMTLYGLTLSSAVTEATLRRSMAPAENEIDGERVLRTLADLVNYIRVLGDDCVAIAYDIYDSTIA